MTRPLDDRAFATAIDANRDALFRYFLRRMEDREDAAEAFGELLLTAWNVRRRMPADEAEARMWLFGVARNILRTERRRLARRSDAVRYLVEQVRAAAGHDDDAVHRDVREAIAELPDDDGELIRLIYWDGLTSSEAGAVLRLNASTVRNRLARVKADLRLKMSSRDEPVSTRHP